MNQIILKNRILVIAAHPDDEVLGCGALLANAVESGGNVKVVFICEGSSCRYESSKSEAAQKAIKLRTEKAIKALSVLGVTDYEFFDLPCGKLDQYPILKLNKTIEKMVSSYRPDDIYTHSFVDANSDHRRIIESVIIATRPGALNFVGRILSFEILSSTEWGFKEAFNPNVFFSVTEDKLKLKLEALSCYGTEIKAYPFSRSLEGVETLARYRGMQSGVHYAEAFHLVREIVR